MQARQRHRQRASLPFPATIIDHRRPFCARLVYDSELGAAPTQMNNEDTATTITTPRHRQAKTTTTTKTLPTLMTPSRKLMILGIATLALEREENNYTASARV